jgi:LemA protein
LAGQNHQLACTGAVRPGSAEALGARVMSPVFAISTLVGIVLGLLIMIALGLLFGVGVFNSLVTLRNRYKNAFSQIDVQLKRRYDLIPNLIEVAKGYMAHERTTLEAVVQARNQAVTAQQRASANPGDPAAMTGLSAADGQVSGALGRLFALAESYPDLKANQNMLALQEELTSTENKVAFARQSFNDAVMNYNTQREVFPASVIATLAGFAPAQLFEIESPKEREAPKVSF